MSRIGVEIATPIDETNVYKGRVGAPTGRRDAAQPASLAQHDNPMKRKREVPTQEEQDPKMKEFLDVMRSKTKTKVWSNGDAVENPTEQHTAEAVRVPAVLAEEASDEEYETVPKKIKVRTTPEEQRGMAMVTQISNEPTQEPRVHETPAPVISEESPTKETESNRAPISDADWARSRTSRLLGLLDEEEEGQQIMAAANTTAAEPESRNEMLQNDVSTDCEQRVGAQEPGDAGASIPTPDSQNDPELSQPMNTEIETARTTMRLFVRNLPYDVTTEALESEFSPYGNLEEVRIYVSSFCSRQHDDYR
jgi:multiple RNA-binding domain-containing protein 1